MEMRLKKHFSNSKKEKPFKGRRPTVSLITDFGYGDNAVGKLHHAVSSIAPNAKIIDYDHGVPPQNILVGAWRVADAVSLPFLREGDSFSVVVDPGVGGERERIAVRLKTGVVLIGPNNGVLSLAIKRFGLDYAAIVENREITLLECAPSSTFDGLYVFSPAAAHAANGVPIETFGRKIHLSRIKTVSLTATRLDGKLMGHIVDIDPFGNIRTNIQSEIIESSELEFGTEIDVSLKTREHQKLFLTILSRTFSEVDRGEVTAVIGSTGCIDLAVNCGNAAYELGLDFRHVTLGDNLKPINRVNISRHIA